MISTNALKKRVLSTILLNEFLSLSHCNVQEEIELQLI